MEKWALRKRVSWKKGFLGKGVLGTNLGKIASKEWSQLQHQLQFDNCNCNWKDHSFNFLMAWQDRWQNWLYIFNQNTPSGAYQTYELNEFLTANHSCTLYNKMFLKKLLYKSLVHIFTLLLKHFAFKLVNYSRQSEYLNIRKNSEIDDIFLR